jgi:hypothetical protein
MSARWLARAAFLLVLAAAADMIGFAGLAGLAMVAVGAAGACLVLAGGYLFLAHRGVVRWLALAVGVLAPVAVLVIFTLHRLLWVALVAIALDAPARLPRRRGALRPPSGHRVDDQEGIRRIQPPVRPSALAGPLLANTQPPADPVRQFARLPRLV